MDLVDLNPKQKYYFNRCKIVEILMDLVDLNKKKLLELINKFVEILMDLVDLNL